MVGLVPPLVRFSSSPKTNSSPWIACKYLIYLSSSEQENEGKNKVEIRWELKSVSRFIWSKPYRALGLSLVSFCMSTFMVVTFFCFKDLRKLPYPTYSCCSAMLTSFSIWFSAVVGGPQSVPYVLFKPLCTDNTTSTEQTGWCAVQGLWNTLMLMLKLILNWFYS